MKTLYMMKGLPASGKSTRAKEMLAEFGSGNAKRVSKDDLRAMLDDGKWSGPNEKFVLKVRDSIILSALADGKHVIVDDTNLAPKHIERLKHLARENEAAFEVVDFTHVSVDECLARDKKRTNYVGADVILRMYRDFLAPVVEPPAYDISLPDAIIVDINGTIAQMNGRGPFDWQKVYDDAVRKNVLDAVYALHGESESDVIFMSGRDGCCEAETLRWLREKARIPDARLVMRAAGDMRKDYIVKRELYEQHVKGRYNVVAIFDDRPQVIRECWQALGFTDVIFNVGDGREF